MQSGELMSSAWSGDAIVYGPPQSMGNKTAFIGKRSGLAHLRERKSEKLRSFQHELRESMRECKPDSPILGPMSLSIEMVMRRPKSHYGTGKNADVLKAGSPAMCTTKPDVDKVLRAIADCGTGIWWRDDAQLCAGGYSKRYARDGEEEHVLVTAYEIREEE